MESRDSQVSGFRQHLIEALQGLTERRQREVPETLQVFLNQTSVGTVDCSSRQADFSIVQQSGPIRTLELRSETGLIIGNVSARELGTTHAEFEGKRYRIAVALNNTRQGVSLRLAYRGNATLVERLAGVLSRIVPAADPPCTVPTPVGQSSFWKKAAVYAQVLLAVSIFSLVVQQAITPSKIQRSDLVQQEPQTTGDRPASVTGSTPELSQDLAVLAGTVQGIASEQRALRAELLNVEKRLAKKRNEVDSRMQAALKIVSADRDQLRDQVRDFAETRQLMANALLKLEQRGPEPMSKSTKTVFSEPANPQTPAEEISLAPPATSGQVADAKRASPMTFYVSFQEGTPETSIDDLIQSIHGRRGPVDAGWYSIEVNLPQPETGDQFLQSLRSSKIVKAANLKPGQQALLSTGKEVVAPAQPR